MPELAEALYELGTQYTATFSLNVTFTSAAQLAYGVTNISGRVSNFSFGYDSSAFLDPATMIPGNSQANVLAEQDVLAEAYANGVIAAYVSSLESYEYSGSAIVATASATLTGLVREDTTNNTTTISL